MDYNKKLIFYHLPKTGGQTIKYTLAKYLKEGTLYINYSKIGRDREIQMNGSIWKSNNLEFRNRAVFVAGPSVNIRTKNKFKPDVKEDYAIIFREPAELIVSLYNYTYRFTRNPIPFSLWHLKLILKGNRNWQLTNFYRHFLIKGIIKSYFLPSLEFFINVLKSFLFVGLTENIDSDIKFFISYFDIENYQIERKNVSMNKGKMFKHLELNSTLRSKLNRIHNLDYEIYKLIKAQKP